MQEVARRAGVAPSSVSRVLSGFPHVSEVMRTRVLDAVAALGYQPDLIAKSLRSGATMTVGFIVGNISNPLISEIALGAEIRLQAAGYSLLLVNSMTDIDVEAKNISLLAQRRVDGILLSLTEESSPTVTNALTSAGVPLVLVDRSLPNDVKKNVTASSILARHQDGVRSAVQHLISLKHRKIGLINGPSGVRPARVRAATLRSEAKLGGAEALVRSGDFTPAHGYESTIALMQDPDPPTALLAGSNQILVGVLQALQDLNLCVPSDVSLVTCDDVPLSAFLDPPVATIVRDHLALGTTAAELMIELLEGKAPRTIEVDTTYRPTSSVGAPRHHHDT